MESVSCALLLRFVNDFCEQYQNEHSPYGVNLSYLFSTRTVYVIPLLNPDGVDICINGVDNSNPLYERLMKMNSMSEDFSHWQANARGVDLNHNYNAGFEEYKHLEIENGTDSPCATRYGGPYPESEPESAALCNFLRSLPNVKALISFHTQGEEIYWEYRGKSHPKAFSCAKIISKLTGYKVCSPENTASYSGLKDWFIEELSGLGYTLECGRGKNPLPPDDYKIIYEKLREFLFCAPILF